MDREPYDRYHEPFEAWLSHELRAKGERILAALHEGIVNKHERKLCHDALAVLCLIYRFDKVDLILITGVAERSQSYADDLAAKLEEETGIRFRLTSGQWGVIRSEIVAS